MTSPGRPASVTVGALWMTVDSTNEQFPTNGAGGATTVAADSMVKAAHHCVLEGISLNDAATTATHVILTDGAGNAIGEPFAIPAAANVGILSQWGIDGAERRGAQAFPGAFGAKLASGTGEVLLWFRIYHRGA